METVITVQSKLIETDYSILKDLCHTQQHLSRLLFNHLNKTKVEKDTFNELQREYIEKYNIHARMFKSIWKDINGKLSSIKSNNKNYKEIDKERLKVEKKKKIKNYKLINKLKQKVYKVSSIWGSKKLHNQRYNTQNLNQWKEEWNRKRNHIYTIIGSKDETHGNSLCQLQSLNKLILTLPKCLQEKYNQKYLELKVNFNYDNKQYQYLFNAINNKQALTFKIIEKDKGWHVNISFTLNNECNYQESGLGIDMNYNLINTCQVKKDGNPHSFKDYKFNIEETSKHQNNQLLSDIANEIVMTAKANNKNVIIEELDLKKVLKNRKISMIAYNKFFSLLKSKCVKEGVMLIGVKPDYTSFIGKVKYEVRFGRTIHSVASYVIGRRGMNVSEKLPNSIIISKLQSGESEISRWKLASKFLKKKLFLEEIQSKHRSTGQMFLNPLLASHNKG